MGSIHQHNSWRLSHIPTPAWKSFAESAPEYKSFHLPSSSAVTEPRCQQHPRHTVWLSQPVRALFVWITSCFIFQLLAHGKIAVSRSFQAGLWSRYSNFRLRLRESNFLVLVPTSWAFWLRLQKNLVQKTGKTFYYLYNVLWTGTQKIRLRLQLHHLKVFGSGSSHSKLLGLRLHSPAFKFPRVESLCAVPTAQSRCVSRTTWGLQLWIAGVVDCYEFLDRGPLPKAQALSLITRATTDARWFWLISGQLLRCQGLLQEGVAVDTFVQEGPCIESTARAVLRQYNNYTWKGNAKSCAKSLFVMGLGGRYFRPFSATTHPTAFWYVDVSFQRQWK